MSLPHSPKSSSFIFATCFFGIIILAGATLSSRAGDYNLTDKPLLLRAAWLLQQQDTVKNDKIFTAVEVNPEFPGGNKAFGQYLGDHIRYPKEAKEKKVQGRVFVQFVVEKDGSLSDIRVLRDPGAGLGEEALRVVSISPNWKPGLQNGKPVRVQYTVPINFTLNDDGPKDNPAVAPFVRYMSRTVRYPRYSKQNNITGVAVASFTVNDDQSIQTVKILKSVSNDIDEEVIRAIKLFKSTDKVPTGTYTIACRFNINEPSKEPFSTTITSMPNYVGAIEIVTYSR